MQLETTRSDRVSDSFFIAIVHNNEAERVDRVRTSIMRFSQHLPLTSCIREFSWQAETEPHSALTAFRRDLMCRNAWRRWAQYLGRQNSYWWAAASLARAVLTTYLSPTALKKFARRSAVEMQVTSKHLRAMEQFVESEHQYLLVVESDVVLPPFCEKRFVDVVLPLLNTIDSSQEIYLDLAGGLDIDALGIRSLIKTSVTTTSGVRLDFLKPVTNTACAYLINRALCVKFMKLIVARPKLRILQIDWLINELFMSIGDAVQVACFHFSPPIFCHGSLTGEYVSWQKDELHNRSPT